MLSASGWPLGRLHVVDDEADVIQGLSDKTTRLLWQNWAAAGAAPTPLGIMACPAAGIRWSRRELSKAPIFSFAGRRIDQLPACLSDSQYCARVVRNGKASADVAAAKTAAVDLKLAKTRKVAAQLNNAEWMASIPGTEEQKSFLLNCVGCHTLERVVRSSHDPDSWTQVIHRMLGYAAVSQPIKPQRLNDPERAGSPEQYRRAADYLATINLSEHGSWEYSLKTMPRATGQSTRVVITEYDLARPTTEPHDI